MTLIEETHGGKVGHVRAAWKVIVLSAGLCSLAHASTIYEGCDGPPGECSGYILLSSPSASNSTWTGGVSPGPDDTGIIAWDPSLAAGSTYQFGIHNFVLDTASNGLIIGNLEVQGGPSTYFVGSSFGVNGTLTVGTLPDNNATLALGGFADNPVFDLEISTNQLVLGDGTGASGQLILSNGGMVTASELTAGNGGYGSVSLYTGSTLISGTSQIGALSQGFAFVDGTSAWSAGDLSVGNESYVSNSGLVYGQSVTITSGTLQNEGTLVLDDSIAFADLTSGDIAPGGPLVVGQEGNGSLTIGADGTLENTGFAEVGQFEGSQGTTMVSGGSWANTGSLMLGDAGTGSLTINGGGSVAGTFAVVGNADTGMGTVSVSGPGSSLELSDSLTVGYAGMGTLTLDEQATLTNENFAEVGQQEGSNGSVTVSNDATWTNAGSLTLGDAGTGALTIESGGTVSNTFAVVGNADTGMGTATVTGAGSSWQLSDSLTVGASGTGSVLVDQQASLSNQNFAEVGQFEGSNGSVTVSNGAAWTNAGSLTLGDAGTGSLTINSGGTVSATFAVVGNADTGIGTLSLTGAGSSLQLSDSLTVGGSGTGTVTVDQGATLTNENFADIGQETGSNGTVTVSNGAIWTNGGSLFVGDSGTGVLNIQSGGQVSNTVATIGNAEDGMGTVTVSGAGSVWSNSGALFVGAAGTGILTVDQGAVVSNGGVGVIGQQSGSTGTVTVSNGATWTSTGQLFIGDAGTGALNIQSGGQVTSGNAFVGNSAGGTGTVALTGAGSQWTATGLTVGGNGSGTVTVDSSAVLNTAGAAIGNAGTGVLIVSNQAVWNATGDIFVGNGAAQGRLTIASGTLSGTDLIVGAVASPPTNFVIVSGSGASMTLSGNLYLGEAGAGSFDLTDGGKLQANNITLGDQANSFGRLTLTNTLGSPSLNASGYMVVGNSGEGILTLNAKTKGTVAGVLVLGENSAGSGTMTVNGSGATWTNDQQIQVGASGTGNLTISGGAVVASFMAGSPTNTSAILGFQTGGSGTALITGAGSRWNQDGNVVVGGFGSGSLTIADGGVLKTAQGTIGLNSGSQGTVTVTGAGSMWIANGGSLSGDINVGLGGAGSLAIADGGIVIDDDAIVGSLSGEADSVLVDGATWMNSGALTIGDGEDDDSVTLEDGSLLQAAGVTVEGGGSLDDDPSQVLDSGAFTLDPGGRLQLDVEGADPSLISVLDIMGAADLHGTLEVDFMNGFAPQAGDVFDLFDAASADLSGLTIEIDGLQPGFEYTDQFSDGVFSLEATNAGLTPTPEPGGTWLAAAGVFLMALRYRKSRVTRIPEVRQV